MSGNDKRFYPDYLSEILAIIFLTLGAASILALLFPPVPGREINFLSGFHPMPEWYFLWLYQLVRYFPGQWACIGAVVLPLCALALFIFIPFIDRGSPGGRMAASISLTLIAASILALSLLPLFRQ